MNSHEYMLGGQGERKQAYETYSQFIATTRELILSIETGPEAYEGFESTAMGAIFTISELHGRVADHDHLYGRQMMSAKDIVIEGMAQLLAARLSGSDYLSFRSELDEWKAIWDEQLQVQR